MMTDKLKLIRSQKAAVVWTVVLALPLLLTLVDSALFLWSLFLLIYLVPWGACTACMTGGLLPMLVGAVSGVLCLAKLFGAAGAGAGILLLLPPMIVFARGQINQTRFPRMVRDMFVAFVVSQLAVLTLLRFTVTGGDVFTAAGAAAQKAISDMGVMGDYMLYLFENMGLLSIPESLAGVASGASLPLPLPLRAELLSQVGNLVSSYLLTLVPVLLTGTNLEMAVMAVALSQHYGRKSRLRRGARDEFFPAIDMPMLKKWYVPRRWGLGFALLGLGYFMPYLSNAVVPVIIGNMCFSVFSTVFTLQGMAVLNDIQHKRGTGKFWRRALPVLLSLILPISLILVGLVDQKSDPRRLRTGSGTQDSAANQSDELI